MYTLRTFKDLSKVNRNQIYLGEVYSVKSAEEEDQKLGIKLRVFGISSITPEDGLAIHVDEYAFIMTSSGQTFETLNRPNPNLNKDSKQEVAKMENK